MRELQLGDGDHFGGRRRRRAGEAAGAAAEGGHSRTCSTTQKNKEAAEGGGVAFKGLAAAEQQKQQWGVHEGGIFLVGRPLSEAPPLFPATGGDGFDGHWSSDGRHATFYPSGKTAASGGHHRQLPRRSNPGPKSPSFFLSSPSSWAEDKTHYHLFTPMKRYSLDGASTRRNLPNICIWESDGEGGDITCEIINTLEASMLSRNASSFDEPVGGGRAAEGQLLDGGNAWSCVGNEAKKPGETISKGHKNYDLMLNLQLGIRYSVGKLASFTQMRELRQGDFDPREKFWTRFPPEGSKITPPHQSVEFRWKDYCPVVFRHLRELFTVDPADYMLAICGDEALRELSSPGKSGSFFYLTQDDRFIIKTVKKAEAKVLIRMLPSYYQHVSQYKNSLVTKFYGMHCIKPIGGQKVRFIVMGNVFYSEYHIHKRFDLKGSSHGRMIDKNEGEIDETTTLKDLDLTFVFRLQHCRFEKFLEQIDRDCEFLEAEGIMDYSLLVGLHFCDDMLASKTGLSAYNSSPCKRNPICGGVAREYHHEESGFEDVDNILNGWPLIHLGVNMPARAEQTPRSETEMYLSSWGLSMMPSKCGETYDVILNFGIIDILQDYDISKKLEHAYKSLQADPTSISAVDPKLYSKRFCDFIRRIFVEDR